MINKRGAGQSGSGLMKVVIVIIAISIVIFLMSLLIPSTFWKTLTSNLEIDKTTVSFGTAIGPVFEWMDYIFGGVPQWLVNIQNVGTRSAIIITLFTWLLLFVTFGDIFASFSTFSKPVSWIAAFSIAVIAANFKGIVVILGFFVGVFAFLGGLAVLAGLVAAFVVFIGLNWGIGSLGPFILRRRAMINAEKKAIQSEVGGEELAGAIRGMKRAGAALREK